MTDTIRNLQSQLDRLADLEVLVPALERDLAQARAHAEILERRLEIAERNRSAHAGRVGRMLGAFDVVTAAIDHLKRETLREGFKPAEEPAQAPTAAKPEHGGGPVDSGEPIPSFLQEFNRTLNGGTHDADRKTGA